MTRFVKTILLFLILSSIAGPSTLFAFDKEAMVWIDGETFWMGSNVGNQAMPHGGVSNEGPVHEVTVDGFWVDKTPGRRKCIRFFRENQDTFAVNWR